MSSYEIYVISKITKQELYSAKGFKKLIKAKQTAHSIKESYYFGEKTDVYVYCTDDKVKKREQVYHFELRD